MTNQSTPSIFRQILILALSFVASFIIFSAIGLALARIIYGFEFDQLLISDPDNLSRTYINMQKFLQVFVTTGTFIVPCFVVPLYRRDSIKTFLGINKLPDLKTLLIVTLLFFSLMPMIEWLLELNSKFSLPESMRSVEIWMQEREKELEAMTLLFLKAENSTDLIINLLVIAVVPAVVEEFFFRGLIQKLFTKWFGNIHIAILITGIIFSTIHFQFYGFLPRLVLGIVLGYIFYFSSSIWASVFGHFINNAVAVILVYLSQKEIIEYQIDETMNTSNLVTIICLGISAAFFLILANYYNKKRDKTKDWIKIYTGSNVQEVEIKKDILENNDIKAIIINKKDFGLSLNGGVELLVEPPNEEDAKRIITNTES